MGSTPTYALPYPELTDSANVPRDQRALAEAVESVFKIVGEWAWARQTANQSIPSGSATSLATLSLETGSSGVTLVGSQLKVLSAGLYIFGGILTFTHNTNGARSMFLRKGTTVVLRSVGAVGTNSTSSIFGLAPQRFAANDLVDAQAYQSSGAALNTDMGSNGCSFFLVKLTN